MKRQFKRALEANRGRATPEKGWRKKAEVKATSFSREGGGKRRNSRLTNNMSGHNVIYMCPLSSSFSFLLLSPLSWPAFFPSFSPFHVRRSEEGIAGRRGRGKASGHRTSFMVCRGKMASGIRPQSWPRLLSRTGTPITVIS